MAKWTKWPTGDPNGPHNILNMMRVLGRLVWSKQFQRNAAALMNYGDADSSPGSWIPTGSNSWREFFWRKLCVKNCRSPWNGGLQEEMPISQKLQMWPSQLKGSLEMWLRISGWEHSGISRGVQKKSNDSCLNNTGVGVMTQCSLHSTRDWVPSPAPPHK